ncbi:MAG: nucleotidyltransferase domain-containing protein, partial [Amedibacillus dolichus]|nr:nucleotidyltransferase domain-containing protein [Amedibacillus dolichus]
VFATLLRLKNRKQHITYGKRKDLIYEKNETILKDLYKSASFVIQAIYFQQSGNYIRRQNELLCMVEPDEQQIIKTFLELKKGGEVSFQAMSNTIFTWSKKWIKQI